MSQTIQDQPQEQRKPNRLIHEKSPYLLQHAYNPVDWFPWGKEAFRKAREEDKPIFLSIGYSTCYWCHVMEREVFENQEIADLMNEALVCIKVDREERPDLDRVYMSAVQALTGSGGWPMSVFLTHDLKPFFGGTYFPPEPQPGRPGFPQLVKRISELWHHDREKLLESSDQVTDYVRKALTFSGSETLGNSVITKAYDEISASYDTTYAGFGGGPKFPRPVTFNFLLRYYERTGQQSALHMTLATLRAMARGGMYDHIGGGFHRYSVDEQWRVPHFEKMLYDQAQLATSYLEAYQITHDEMFSNVARDVLDYVLRAMTHPEGGFYSAEDAESALSFDRPDEKEEGTFYLWTANEIEHLLGKDTAAIFNYYYGVEENGNALSDPLGVFKGKNILYAAHTIEETTSAFHRSNDDVRRLIEESRKRLFSQREQRPKPHLDDKIITAWNGLMISAFAKASQLLDDSTYLNAAVRSARFIQSKLYDAQTHQLLRRYRDGEARFDGTLQDYAFLSSGLLDLYEASFDITWLSTALALTKRQIELFGDTTDGGFFDTQAGDSSLLIRTKEDYDGAEPTGNSIAALNLLRLAQITDNKEWHALAERTIKLFASRLNQRPEVLPQLLVVCERLLSTPKEIIVAGSLSANDTKQLLREIHNHFIPNKILLLVDGSTGQQQLQSALPFIEGMKMINGKATAYICENYACQLPTSDTAVVSQLLTKKNATR